jgi:hypothetical protein
MRIECYPDHIRTRDAPVKVPQGNDIYHFMPDAHGRLVAEVHDERHIACFLSCGSMYRELQPNGSAEVPPVPATGIVQIAGIGARLAQKLATLGVEPGVDGLYQIAEWDAERVVVMEQALGFGFKGRIQREDWVGQAKSIVAQAAAAAQLAATAAAEA